MNIGAKCKHFHFQLCSMTISDSIFQFNFLWRKRKLTVAISALQTLLSNIEAVNLGIFKKNFLFLLGTKCRRLSAHVWQQGCRKCGWRWEQLNIGTESLPAAKLCRWLSRCLGQREAGDFWSWGVFIHGQIKIQPLALAKWKNYRITSSISNYVNKLKV